MSAIAARIEIKTPTKHVEAGTADVSGRGFDSPRLQWFRSGTEPATHVFDVSCGLFAFQRPRDEEGGGRWDTSRTMPPPDSQRGGLLKAGLLALIILRGNLDSEGSSRVLA